MFVKAQNYRSAIVIYYSRNKEILRVPTRITRVPNDKSFFKDNKLTSKYPDHEACNQTIDKKLKLLDDIIADFYNQHKIRPGINYVKSELDKYESGIRKKDKAFDCFENHFEDMITQKKTEAIVKASVKDYISTKNALMLYQHMNRKITLDALNSASFIVKFEKFLSEPHGNEVLRQKYKTKCGLNANTIRKRVSCLKVFLKWCESQGLLTREKEIVNYVSRVKKFQPTIVILTLEEQKALKALKLDGLNEKVRDIMLFLCQTGLRYSDLLSLCRDDVQNDFIVKDADKSRTKFKVPLNENSKALLIKYNYNFNIFSTAMFNKSIQKILKENKICDYQIQIRNIRYVEIEREKVMKYDEISSHTGRRSFIARCLQNGFTIADCMGFTGHKKTDTLMRYVDLFQNQERAVERFKALEF